MGDRRPGRRERRQPGGRVTVVATVKKKDYEAIAKAKISRPSQSTRKPPRILVYSRNKKGKTRFCATAPNVLIVDPEDGTDRMTKIDPRRWPITEWGEMDEVYNYLKLGRHDYKWVALDPTTRIHGFSLRFVMDMAEERSLDTKPKLVQKQHYGQAGELTKEMLWKFHQLPIGVIYTAQERQIEADSGDEDAEATEAASSYVPDLPKGARAAINSIVDVIGRIYVVKTSVRVKLADGKGTTEKEVLQRRLWLEPSAQYDTGYRSDFVLPPYLKNPTVPRLVELMENGRISTNG